jgi:hypothetical protein
MQMHTRGARFALLAVALAVPLALPLAARAEAQSPTPPPLTGTAPLTGAPATPIPQAAAAAALPILMTLASQETPGMQADGPVFAGHFDDGQVLEHPFVLQANKCYAVLGASVGIQQLDLQVVVQPAPALPPLVVAESKGTGPTASVGGKSVGCIRNHLPISGPAKVLVRAHGSGLAAMQIVVN